MISKLCCHVLPAGEVGSSMEVSGGSKRMSIRMRRVCGIAKGMGRGLGRLVRR
jgi:hypothetical protein